MIRWASCGLVAVLAGVASGQTADVITGPPDGPLAVVRLNPFGGFVVLQQQQLQPLPPGVPFPPGPGGPRPIRPTVTQSGPPKLDRDGDPLPAGAVARFGTARLRHGADIQGMAFTPDAKLLCTLSGTQDSVKLWDTATGKQVAHLETSASLVGLGNPGFAVLIDGTRCKVWFYATNVTRDLPEKTLPEGSEPSALAVHPDGRSFAVAAGAKVLVIDLQTGKTLQELNVPGPPPNNNLVLQGPNGPVNGNGNNQPPTPATRLMYSPDGKWLAGSGQQTGVWLWELRTGKRVRTYRTAGDSPEYAFSPDVTKIAVTGERLHLYSLDSEEPVSGFKGPEGVPLLAPRFSADGKTISIVLTNGAVQPYDAATGEGKDTVEPPEEGLRPPVVLAPQGAMVAAVDQTAGVRIWNPKTGKGPEVNRLPGLWQVGFTADGKGATTLDVANKVHTFDPATGAPGKPLDLGIEEDGLPAVWDPLSRRAAAVTINGEEIEVRVIDADTKKELSKHTMPPNAGVPTVAFAARNRDRMAIFGQGVVMVVNPATGKTVRTLDVPRFNGETRGTLSPDGRVVATTGVGVTVWEVATGKKRFAFDTNQLAGVAAFSPDAKLLAVWDATGAISVHDLRSGALVRKVPADEPISALAFAADGKRLAGGFHAGHVTVWDVITGDTLAPFVGHDGEVCGLCFSADGKRLLSSSRDGTALVWEVPDKPQATGPAEAAVAGFDEAFRLLGAADAAQAQRGLEFLYRQPADAVKQIADRVPAPAPTPAATLAKHLADLESDDFATREAAAKALEVAGGEAGALLRAAAEKSTNAEVRKTAAELLGKIDAPATKPADLKMLRAVEVLEGLGTADARALLEKWAGGPTGHRVTAEAAAALARLKANDGK